MRSLGAGTGGRKGCCPGGGGAGPPGAGRRRTPGCTPPGLSRWRHTPALAASGPGRGSAGGREEDRQRERKREGEDIKREGGDKEKVEIAV